MSTSPPGDTRAQFTELYQRDHRAVVAFVLRRLPDGDFTRAEDIAQDAFIAAWRNFSSVPKNPSEARAWLFSAARSWLLRDHRTQVRRGALAVRIASEADFTVAGHDDAVSTIIDLTLAWNSLSAADQEAIALTIWDGLTSAEAAKVVGITPSAFRFRLMRARRNLWQLLAPSNDAQAISTLPLYADAITSTSLN
jgi:RNA polymerase sigma-70 factor (ECF subfamily)